MDRETRDFSNKIIEGINRSRLPIEIKRLCLYEIYQKVSAAADGEIQRQIAERDKEVQEAKKYALEAAEQAEMEAEAAEQNEANSHGEAYEAAEQVREAV